MAGAGAAAAEACARGAASQGFLMLDPPLPLELLRCLGAADMLSLSGVCRALRCASFELLRREEVAMQQMNSPGDSGSACYIPLQLPSDGSGGSGGGGPGLDGGHGDGQGGGGQVRGRRQISVAERRRMRCYSLLCGSPEAAAAQHRQHDAEERASRTEEGVEAAPSLYAASAFGRKYDYDDCFSKAVKAMRIWPGWEIDRILLDRWAGCALEEGRFAW